MKNKYLLILIFSTLALSYLFKIILNIDDLIFSSFLEQMTMEKVEQSLALKSKWEWVSYAIIPVLVIIKISIVATVIDIGCFFFDKRLNYKKIFNIVVRAEYIFLLIIIIKIVWFYFFKPNFTLEDLQYFYPLSALNIVGYDGLNAWWIYPFQVLNLFELAYWFILAYLIGKELKIATDKGLSIVASSYGVALLIWVVGFMFFTLNVS